MRCARRDRLDSAVVAEVAVETPSSEATAFLSESGERLV